MHLLQIDSSILGENSVSRRLTAAIVAREAELHPGLEITRMDLTVNPPLHLTPQHVGAMFGQPPSEPAVTADIAATAHYIDDLFAADIIVIGAPMYNFTIPSHLKAWIDRVLIANKTFKYGADGVPVGLVPAGKKVFIASARGGKYGEGSPVSFLDHQETLLKAALSFIGLTDITVIRAEGVAVPELKDAAIAGAEEEISQLS